MLKNNLIIMVDIKHGICSSEETPYWHMGYFISDALANKAHAEFYIKGCLVGTIAPKVLVELKNYPDYFKIDDQNGRVRDLRH